MKPQKQQSAQTPSPLSIQTSENNPMLEEKIRRSSEKFIKRNYRLYKALENK